MKQTILLLISLFWLGTSVFSQDNPIIEHPNHSWSIQSKSFLYHLSVDKAGNVNEMYFGNKSQDYKQLTEKLGEEISVRGGYSTTTPMLEVIFGDQVRDIELEFVQASITSKEGFPTLIIEQKDKYYPLTVIEYLRVLPEYDLIEKWIELKNTGKKGSILVENAQSGSLFLPKDDYSLTQLAGTWGNEFQPNQAKITQGTKTMQVKDFRSFGSSYFAIRPTGENGENCGKVWYGTLCYSGNWRVDVSKYSSGQVQVVSGINFWDQSLNLKANESFTSPKMIIGYTEQGTGGVARNLSAYTREQVLPDSHKNKIRPILYNSWYATAFNVNEEHQLALAKIAKELGVETFVIDDGWFKGRLDDHAALGDWTVDKNKFPNGLKPMIDKIRAMGLDFGIWIEPEMVNPNSELYRTHPDWVFHYPNRTRHEGRNQLMLNLAREDVYQYLYTSFHKLLKENNISYIKWDMNKSLTDPGFPSASNDEKRAVRLKYVNNLYRLIDQLRSEFPEVWFENCASGGGRVDLGMLSKMDLCWASDNTDPVERIFIQDSYLGVFPANTMISWVTEEDWHKQNHPLSFKFDVSMAGVLGVGYDITKWNEEEKQVAKEKIARYKEIRKTVQFGTNYRLISPYQKNKSVLEYVNPDQSHAVVFVYNLAVYPANSSPETRESKLITLQGLDPQAKYTIEGIKGSYQGDFLMKVGIEFPLYGAFKSAIYQLRKQA